MFSDLTSESSTALRHTRLRNGSLSVSSFSTQISIRHGQAGSLELSARAVRGPGPPSAVTQEEEVTHRLFCFVLSLDNMNFHHFPMALPKILEDDTSKRAWKSSGLGVC